MRAHRGRKRSSARSAVRVTHVIESLAPGGAERQLVSLLRAFKPEDVQSRVVTVTDRQDLAPELQRLGIRVDSLGVTSPRDWPAGVVRLRRLVREHRTEIVHTRLTTADLLGRLVSLSCPGVAVMSTVEAPVYSADVYQDAASHRRWKVQVLRFLDGLTGRLAGSHYVACSHTVAGSIGPALHLSATRLTVIPNSVPIGRLPSASVNRLTPHDHVTLLCVGRMSPQKGHRYLLDALPDIVQAYPQVRLQLVGSGPLEDELRRQVSDLNLDDRVEFLGLRHDVPELMQSAQLMVMPSLWEGLSIVALESMAAGLPTVTSDISSMREAFGDDGGALLVAPRSPELLSTAVVRLLGDRRLRHRLAATARARAEERYDVEKAAAAYLSVYLSLRGRSASVI